MKHLATVIVMSILLVACQAEPQLEKHDLRLDSFDALTQSVQMYDYTLDTEVSITYSYDLFKVPAISVYEVQRAHPIYTFMYSDKNYYAL